MTFLSFITLTMRRSRMSLVALVVVAVLLVSCARDDDASGQTEPPIGETADPQPTEELVIYTYDAFPQSLELLIAEYFESEFGFTPTLERFQDTGGLYNEIWLERSRPQADVAIGLDNTYAGQALAAELFQAYRPLDADQLQENLVIDPEFRLTPFDWGHIVLNYDSESLPDAPSTWEELLDPRLRESIILMNPATSSPGRNFLLLTIAVHGEDGYLDYWEELKPNILTITSGWSEGYGLYTQGESPVVLSYESSPAYHIVYENTERYKNLILDDQGYAQIEVAGIISGARNIINARRFMDYILTEEFQQELPLSQFMYPVRRGVTLPEAFERLERAGETVFMSVDRVDENFGRWLDEWQDVMR